MEDALRSGMDGQDRNLEKRQNGSTKDKNANNELKIEIQRKKRKTGKDGEKRKKKEKNLNWRDQKKDST